MGKILQFKPHTFINKSKKASFFDFDADKAAKYILQRAKLNETGLYIDDLRRNNPKRYLMGIDSYLVASFGDNAPKCAWVGAIEGYVIGFIKGRQYEQRHRLGK